MSKNRYFNTGFWDDNYIVDLDPTEKFLFIYCLTNPLTSICGIYEISLKRIAFDTGIDKDMIIKLFNRFENDGKIKYRNGWIAIKNFIKHQKCSDNENDKINIGIKNALKISPELLVNWVLGNEEEKKEAPLKPLIDPLNYINLNSNINTNINTKAKSKAKPKKKALAYNDYPDIKLYGKELVEEDEECIKLREKHYNIFIDEFGKEQTWKMIKYLLYAKQANGYTCKSDYFAIRKWVIKACDCKPIKNETTKDLKAQYEENEKIRSNNEK